MVSAPLAKAQNWNNPADRYLQSYKQYENATCSTLKSQIKHYVYFIKERQAIKDHPFLQNHAFDGAQIMYSWRELEPEQGQYDFTSIEEDLSYLKKFNKKLFIQLQDASFSMNNNPVPKYLTTGKFAGGAVNHYENSKPVGWVAKRWDKTVQATFADFLSALGKEFDGRIEGINLQETALSIDTKKVTDFSESDYVAGLKANMLSLKAAFPTSTTMIYANFVPGEWLPWEDKGYLKSLYAYGDEIGVGLGAPDLMVTRKGQLNHALAQMHENELSVPLGIAVQDGNYIGKTGADSGYKKSRNAKQNAKSLVPMLHAFADGFLGVDYMFWVNQSPYFEKEVLPCFSPESD